MKRIALLSVLGLAMLASGPAAAWAFEFAPAGYGTGCAVGGHLQNWAYNRSLIDPNVAQGYTCWHGYYSHTGWGTPVALVVPPTAENQTHWGWGVGNTRITPIAPQFGRNYGGPGWTVPGALRATPRWPSDTDQFGVYPVRGPW
jgi:hypothetical protein